MREAPSSYRGTAIVLGRMLPLSRWSAILLAVGLVAWLTALMLTGSMQHGPGTPVHDLPMFLIGWVVMLTAMMLPSELSFIDAFAALLKSRDEASAAPPRTIICFMAGYGIAWIAYGLVAYGFDTMVRATDMVVMRWYRAGPLLASSVLIVAGLFQVSSLKRVCLTHCRTPLAFFARNWREGDWGATQMGVRHGLICVGCCWALMAVMFAVGAMSLTWMALLTLFMFAEKVLPQGQKLTIPIACFLWSMGIWIAVSPETAPLLKDPMIFGTSLCRGV